MTETKVLKKKLSKSTDMIGNSDAIEKIKTMIERVAPTEARVLIEQPAIPRADIVNSVEFAQRLHQQISQALGCSQDAGRRQHQLCRERSLLYALPEDRI